MKHNYLLSTLLGFVLAVSTNLYAGSITIPHNFNAGSPARAAEVNTNFASVKTAVDDNHGRVSVNASDIAALQAALDALQTTVSTLQTDLATANSTIADLTAQLGAQASQISAINNSEIMALDPYVTVTSDNRGSIATFSALNLQLVNGTGTTDGVPNGLGNLIIGYDATRNRDPFICSLGTYTNQTDCESNGSTWAVSHKSGSHYLVIGDRNNYSQYAGMVNGTYSTSNHIYASVSGGYGNTASGYYSSVSGGAYNTANGTATSVSGGAYNAANGADTSVSGGYANVASGSYSSISGGINNTAIGKYSSVSGGGYDQLGYGNTANADFSSILGGMGKTTTYSGQTIPTLP